MNVILKFSKNFLKKQSVKCGVSNKDQSHHIFARDQRGNSRCIDHTHTHMIGIRISKFGLAVVHSSIKRGIPQRYFLFSKSIFSCGIENGITSKRNLNANLFLF